MRILFTQEFCKAKFTTKFVPPCGGGMERNMNKRKNYVQPELELVEVSTDIITESNDLEWDDKINGGNGDEFGG